MLKLSSLILLSTLIFILLAFGAASVEAGASMKISTNNFYDDWPHIENGKIVWSSGNNDNHDIFLYDFATATTTQITNTIYSERYPEIEDGKIVWMGGYNVYSGCCGWEIFLYDIATATTTSLGGGVYPHINSGKVTWYGGNDVILYDIATATKTTITNNTNQQNNDPQVNDKYIVWTSSDGRHDLEIHLYDIATATITRITDNDYEDSSPMIDGEKVVWEGFENGDWEIFIYDISTATTTKITDNNYWDNGPNINNDKVVWYAGGSIYLYDIITQNTIQIGDTYSHYMNDERPQIRDGMVAWGGGINNDIFRYDIVNGTTTIISDSEFEDKNPRIESGRVVWQGYDSENKWNIYLWDDSLLAPQVGSLNIAPNPVQLTKMTTATATFADPDIVDTHTAIWDWGDGSLSTGNVTESNGSGNVAGAHAYNQAGDYIVTLKVIDNHGVEGIRTENVTAYAIPSNKDQCKNDGWKSYQFLNFKNQGECVSYVTTHSY